MDKRKLGHSDVAIAPLVLGGNVFGWSADEAARSRCSTRSSAKACNFIDTADTYSGWVPGNRGGESETIIGRWLKQSGKRDQVVIATKVAQMVGSARACRRRTSRRPPTIRCAGSASSASTSISRTRTMPPCRSKTRSARSQRLIEAGKVRTIGASNYSARAARRGAGGQREARTAALRSAAAGIQPRRAQGLRRRTRAARRAARTRRRLLLRAGERIPDGKYRSEARSWQELGARRRGREISQSARLAVLAALDEVAARIARRRRRSRWRG